jgi:DNA invertase Pin-like site-specific DNA recombinase
MKNTAAIYARVSSERQKEEGTIASQTALLLEYAKAHELSVPSEWIFEDEGYSGATLARPGLERLRDLAAEGQIEVVLIYAPDRLSRKYAYQVLLTEEFCRHGVETIFLKSAAAETPEERLMLQFQGMIAEYERAQIAERTRRGKRHRAKTGCVNVLCGAPYGYRYIRKSEHSQAYYEVTEGSAEVVRRIFAWYTQELLSIGAIARRLNKDPRPKGVVLKNGLCKRPRTVLVAYGDVFKIGTPARSRTASCCEAHPVGKGEDALGLQIGAPRHIRFVQHSSFSDHVQSTWFPLLVMKSGFRRDRAGGCGNVPRCGECFATRPIKAAPVLAKPRSVRGRG